MTEEVPNEILAEILFHAVTISTQTFEAWRTDCTFAGKPSSPACNVLLVSKRWRALAIPFVYESAIIRTRFQAQGLIHALKHSDRRGSKSWPTSPQAAH
ncbi:hypothetical protein C8Q80DRAFT_366733 [Daedaleopsis nitida]|nr:hypothetical protein C8Q80DRAFT_366733 [Daedaleopsis nitida]